MPLQSCSGIVTVGAGTSNFTVHFIPNTSGTVLNVKKTSDNSGSQNFSGPNSPAVYAGTVGEQYTFTLSKPLFTTITQTRTLNGDASDTFTMDLSGGAIGCIGVKSVITYDSIGNEITNITAGQTVTIRTIFHNYGTTASEVRSYNIYETGTGSNLPLTTGGSGSVGPLAAGADSATITSTYAVPINRSTTLNFCANVVGESSGACAI